VLDGYTFGPAAVFDPIGNTLAFNLIGDFVYSFSGYDGPWGDNLYWRLFMDPYRRQMYVDWTDFARYGVGLMRGLCASRKDDSVCHEMIGDLRRSSPDFHRMWNESAQQGTSSYAPNRIRLQTSELGQLDFLAVRLTLPMKDAFASFLTPVDDLTRSAMLSLGSGKTK
jgi:hypothetical protein